jgi:phosphoribosylformimino-5-aminoimidazole carboxamide ribotide isomerase
VAAVILYPAIDLKNGQCVRLRHGDMDQGFRWLHVVDLDGAFAGRPANASAVTSILRAVGLPIQLGGGIRTMAQIEEWLALGVSRVILGTAALKAPDLVREACRAFPSRIAVGIDARKGQVAVEGWAETSELTALELAKRFEGAGVAAIIFTDIDRDGMLAGLNIGSTAALARAVKIPVIASGGLASIADVERLITPEARIIAGAIAGRALYDGRLDAAAALRLIAESCP